MAEIAYNLHIFHIYRATNLKLALTCEHTLLTSVQALKLTFSTKNLTFGTINFIFMSKWVKLRITCIFFTFIVQLT